MPITKKQVGASIILLAILLLLASSALFQNFFNTFTGTLSEYVGNHYLFGPFVFIVLGSLSILLGPFSSAPLIPPAVVIWGVPKTFVLLLVSWLIGNTLAYLLGRFIGNKLVKKILNRKNYEAWINELGQKVDMLLAFLFRLAMPSETGYIFGALKYNFVKYFVITFFAELPFAIITVYAGDAFAKTGWVSFLFLILIWIVLILLAMKLFRRKIRRIKQKNLR